jgi:trigger factor
MQVTETLNDGLKRELKIVVPAGDLAAKLTTRLEDAKGRARINGFRPGKVPMAHMRKMYGKSMMAEVVNEIINETPGSVLSGRGEKSATRPEVAMTEDEAEAEKILAGNADFEFSLAYEVLPAIEIGDFSDISITREVVDIPDAEVEEQVGKVAASAREFTTKEGKATDGDRVTIDYVGRIDGEAFDGGADNGSNLTLGSNQFIPGFEEQLVGAKAGDERKVTVSFPTDYPAAHLAGKEAVFDVTVHEVAAPAELVIDDDLAKKLGLESADRLRKVIREQMESQFGSMTRQKVKRQILDALDSRYKFETPSSLVDAEFNNIWQQITAELEQSKKTFADEDTTEEAAREEYRTLAERRVRLGLVLSEIGQKAEVEVTQDELQRAIYDQVRQYKGQEQQVFDYFKNNPDAVAGLRAPLFEEKVIDHLMTQIKVEDKSVTKEALMADDDDDAAKAEPADKSAKKPAAKKKAKAADAE